MTVDEADLTRFQRILVGTDGTVTHLLEAYADESVDVVKLQQVFDTSSDADLYLGLSGDHKVLRRRVLLRGRRSRRSLLYAEAVLALDRVEPDLVEALLATAKPMGQLLAERRMETFREVLEVEREPAGPVGAHFGVDGTADVITRTYRIVAGRQPIVVITEKFPADFFRGLTA